MSVRSLVCLGAAALLCAGCVGGSRGTGVRTFEPRPESEDGVRFPWQAIMECDRLHPERCKERSKPLGPASNSTPETNNIEPGQKQF